MDVKPSKARYVSMSSTPNRLVCFCCAATLDATRPLTMNSAHPAVIAVASP